MKIQIIHLSIIFICMFLITSCAAATGSIIITGTPRHAISSSQVVIYLTKPTQYYELIGLVAVPSDSGWYSQGNIDIDVEELKKQVAKVGANGILLIDSNKMTGGFVAYSSVAYSSSTEVTYISPIAEKVIIGKAIYIKNK